MRIVYAITTHKSQGPNINSAPKDIDFSAFTCCQVHAALWRVTSLDGRYLIVVDSRLVRNCYIEACENNQRRYLTKPYTRCSPSDSEKKNEFRVLQTDAVHALMHLTGRGAYQQSDDGPIAGHGPITFSHTS
ncbi:hypothetical protein EVAR_11869_1 [Eumeta japonica]|uniref:Uncharacterized protein n=1 Tax=Eumeta variegata TaxID=151549 RepID=A0A4C1U7H5_EUMVA|nr:hypothetical protein EVAR_11869_1 [Eumeta japonica]